MFEMYIEATVRGYHAYLDDASVRIGEILACEMELDNSHDMLWWSKTKMETWLDMYQRNYPGSFISFLMILENLRQNALEIGSMQEKEKELKSLWTIDLWAMMYIWESSRGNYLRRILLMIST